MRNQPPRLTSGRLVLSLLLHLAFCGLAKGEQTPPAPTLFSLTDRNAKAVHLAGEFNNWNTTSLPMQRAETGQWTATVPLRPGHYHYKFIVDGRWVQDFSNPDEDPDGFGGKNSIVTVRDPSVDPVMAEKDAVRATAALWFAKKDYAALEKTADEFRRSKARFSDGLWKLMEFYDGLKAAKEISDHKDWQPWFDKLEAWHQAFPESLTQPVVLARGWSNYAWDARGSGWSDTITEEGGRLFDERLAKARAILEAAPSSHGRCPNWYGVMQDIALGQGWKRAEYHQLLTEATKATPTFYHYYWNAAIFLLPRWSGRRGEWEHLAEDAAKELDPAEGLAAYTRTVWSMSAYYGNVFKETSISWPKVKQGFLDIEKQYPDSRWNLNAFGRFAVMAGDRETARSILQRIGEHGDPAWGGYARYELARRWADPSTPRWQIEPVRTLREETHSPGPIQSVAFTPDGKWIAGGGEGGRVTLWEAATGKEIWSEEVSDDPVLAVAISPNGKLLAAGAGQANQTTRPGLVKVWNLQTKAELVSVQPKGTVWSIAFGPAGETLAIGGGWYDKQAEASLLDIAAGELHPLPWTKSHDHGLRAVALSPDGQALVADCYQSISVWSIPGKRMLFDTHNALKTFARALAFSPDGRTLAVGGMPVWAQHDTQPGGLTLWDTATWKEFTPRIQDDASGLATVAYSPDGKWIAGGGQDQAVHVWDAATLQPKTIYIGHDGIVWSVAFAPDGKTLASASDDGTIKIWKLSP